MKTKPISLSYRSSTFILGALLLLGSTSCKVYKQHILFTGDGNVDATAIAEERESAEEMYLLRPFDELNLEVFTGEGERLIDPDFELAKRLGISPQMQNRPNPTYTIQADSTVRLPMIGSLKVAGLTKQEAELKVQRAFQEYYLDAYALLNITSRRVIVLGATGGQVIPLTYEGMNLLEVLALAGGIPSNARGQNIRLIRGPFENPSVQIVDLTTLEGMQMANLKMHPGDVVYVEPRPQIIQNGLRDVAPILNLLTTSATLVLFIINLTTPG